MSDGILIIGAGGFLGSALSRRLLGQGRSIHRLLRAPAPSLGKGDTVHVGDLNDIDLIRTILPMCNTIFHLGSATTPGSSANRPSMEAELNLLPTMHLLEALHDFPLKRLIFTSSGGTLYGNPKTATVAETAALSPLSYHGAGKLATEAFLRTFHNLTGLSVTVLRPSNLYGPGQSLREGFGLIRTILENARCGSPINIWGDGESVRDFLYIDDMVNACCRVLSNHHSAWQVFNVGSGEGHSINQIRQMVEEVTGIQIPAIYHSPRPGDVRRFVLDCSTIRYELGWNPVVPLSDGIHHTWRWLESSSQCTS
jgi:UDP-glucose 4-epimerase